MATLLQQLQADYEVLLEKYKSNSDKSLDTAKLILKNGFNMIETQCRMEQNRIKLIAEQEARRIEASNALTQPEKESEQNPTQKKSTNEN